MSERLAEIRRRLATALEPRELQVTDESHKHEGHAGARDGRGHFHVYLRSESLRGLSPVARHRKVYSLLADLMETDIHALSLDLAPPDESKHGDSRIYANKPSGPEQQR